MGVRERSRERVEETLDGLAEVYGSFPINQRTLSLPADRYADLRSKADPRPLRAYAAVRNDADEILHVGSGEDPELPGIAVSLGSSLEPRLRQKVKRTTGVDCALDGLDRVTIVGLGNASDTDAETLYNLVVVFSGYRRAGTPDDGAEWRTIEESVGLAYA